MAGTPAKPPAKKPRKVCPDCGLRFLSRARMARHAFAHRITAEDTDPNVEEAKQALSELERLEAERPHQRR